MKRVGLIGVIMAALLVISATPAMAAETNNVTLNATGLYLYDFDVNTTSGDLPLTIQFTFYMNNTHATNTLTGTVYVYVDGARTETYTQVSVPNSTYGATDTITYTLTEFPLTGEYKVSVGNDTHWLPNVTISVFVKDDGPVSISGMQIDRFELSDDEIDLGDQLTIYVDYGKNETQTRRVAVIDWATYNADVRGDISTLLSKADAVWTLSEGPASDSYTFTPDEPGYYLAIAFNSTDIGEVLGFRVVPAVSGKPTVSISVDKSSVAIGDYVKVEASMSTDVAVSNVKVFVTGSGYFLNETGYGGTSYMLCYAPEGEWYRVKDACGKDEWWVKISNVPEGTYVAKIDVGSGATRAEATAVFKVFKPAILSLDVPSTHVKGRDLVIEGTTNLAKSGTNSDNATYAPSVENWAYLTIKDLAGDEIVNSTITTAAMSYIDEGGKFRFKIDNFGSSSGAGGELDTGYYKVIVNVTSGILTDEETAVMEIVKPEIKLIADKTTVTRGDTVTFTIDTNLKVNNAVNFTIEDTDFCTGDPDCAQETTTYYVDVFGDVVIKLDVNTMAPLTDYKFTAEIPGLGVSDEIRVTVVKQKLNITAEDNVVVRGGSVRFTGSTTADVVYVYADEPGVFQIGSVDVEELPSDTILDTREELTTAMVYPDSNDILDFKVDVLVQTDQYGDVSPGTYYLYFYAPANVTGGEANRIDRASDAQAIVAISVTDPKIELVDIPSKLPYQGEVEVNILTAPGDRDNVVLTFTLEGSNVKARPNDFGVSTEQKPNSNNWVNFTLDLKEYAVRKGDTLEPGLYVFNAKLKFTSDLGGDEVDSKNILVEIVPQSLDVQIEPISPVVGDKITVTVTTNREGVSGYDHIWVTMVGTNYKAVQRITLDSTGKGSVTFETVGLAAGTYKFYVRDTAGTWNEEHDELYVPEELYYLDPADALAKVYNAHDDLLVIKTVEILESAPTTTTTAVATTTAVTTTTAVATTTAVKTTTAVATTTPQEGGGVPGFEAVFAIAGLLAVAYLLRRK